MTLLLFFFSTVESAFAVEKSTGRKKTFAERIDELEARQKNIHEAGTGRDARIAALEKKLQALETGAGFQPSQALTTKIAALEKTLQALETRAGSQPSEALTTRIAELERKVRSLANQLELPEDRKDSDSGITRKVTRLDPNSQMFPVKSDVSTAKTAPINLLDVAAAPAEYEEDSLWNRESFTNGFFGLGDSLADSGIEVSLGITNIYQANVRGGTSTHHKRGRHTGSYDLEIGADLQRLLGLEGGSLYMHTEGSWSRFDVDEISVGSVFGANADGAGRRAMDVTELWYEQALCDDTLRVRLGKLDITGGFECRGCPVSFDSSSYANDETAMFLNNALVNNPTIPFPDVGLGAVIHWNPIEWWYASLGAADAQADGRETGFRTAFHGEDYFFYAFETGVTPEIGSANGPLPGAYRIGLWNDSQDKERFSNGTNRRDDTGFYLTFDQMVYKETNDPEDTQGLGVVTRYGWASDQVNDVTDFWSLALQYQGLLEGRDDDLLGLGFAQGAFSEDAGYVDDYESVLELYYNAQIAPWMGISPSIQYITDPGGSGMANDAVVIGLRAQTAF
jgi:porin